MATLVVRHGLNGAVVPDTHLDENWPDTAFGTTGGTSPFDHLLGASGSNNRQNLLFNFPTSGVPSGAIIQDAELRLVPGFFDGGEGFSVKISKLSQSGWIEASGTWNKYDGVNNWTTPGGDVTDPFFTFTHTIPSGTDPFVISGFKTFVQDAIENVDNQLHFRISKTSPSVAKSKDIRNNTSTSSQRPQLTINYYFETSGNLNFFIYGSDSSGILEGNNALFYFPADNLIEDIFGVAWNQHPFLPSFSGAVIESGFLTEGIKGLKIPTSSGGYNDLSGAKSVTFCAWTNNSSIILGYGEISTIQQNEIAYQPFISVGELSLSIDSGAENPTFILPSSLKGILFEDFVFIVGDIRLDGSGWVGRISISGQPWQLLSPTGDVSHSVVFTDNSFGIIDFGGAPDSTPGIVDELCLWRDTELFTDTELCQLWQLAAIYNDRLDTYTGHQFAASGNINLFIHGRQLINNNNDLFIRGQTLLNDNINLFINGLISSQDTLNLFIHGQNNVDDNIDCFISGHIQQSGSVDLYMEVIDIDSDDINLFVNGHLLQNNNIDLFASGLGFVTGTLPITSYCQIRFANNDMPYYITGHNMVSGQAINFVIGALASSNNDIPLLIIGKTLPPTLSCPILDPTASIQIGNDIIEIYQSRIDALINQLGKNIILNFDPKLDICINCLYDPVKKISTGIYRSGGPLFFQRGSQCPYCKAKGFLETPVQKCIKALVQFNPKDAVNYDISVNRARSIIRIKTFLDYADDLIKANSIWVDYAHIDALKIVAKMIRQPIPIGLRDSRYCISYFEQVSQ